MEESHAREIEKLLGGFRFLVIRANGISKSACLFEGQKRSECTTLRKERYHVHLEYGLGHLFEGIIAFHSRPMNPKLFFR